MKMSGRLRYVRLARLVWRLPTYARVVWGLVRDPRTPLPLKGLLARRRWRTWSSPLDLIPDAIPIIGQADDLTVLLLVLDLFIANAPREVREEQHRARAATAPPQLDQDLARLRGCWATRYDQIRDRLPELLERYGDLRDSRAGQGVLKRLAARRMARRRASADDAGHAVEAPSRRSLN